MTPFRPLPIALSLLAATALAAGAHAADRDAAQGGWKVEQGTARPHYAVAEATRTNLNVDEVVLACTAGEDGQLLQIQLLLSDDGPLDAVYPHTAAMKNDPKAIVTVDGRDFPASLLFADDRVVVADAQDGPYPMLSKKLSDALQTGRTMSVRVDLLEKAADAPAIDGETVVNLRAPGGPEAIAAVRHCADAGSPSIAEVPAHN
jgi:Flp pilus assembly protein CpaB